MLSLARNNGYRRCVKGESIGKKISEAGGHRGTFRISITYRLCIRNDSGVLSRDHETRV